MEARGLDSTPAEGSTWPWVRRRAVFAADAWVEDTAGELCEGREALLRRAEICHRERAHRAREGGATPHDFL